VPTARHRLSLTGPDTPRSPLRIVSIGGGNGLSVLLKGLKHYTWRHAASGRPVAEVTAVVTVTDDGGSSGRLRRELGMLPPGDIRNCMTALAEDEALLTRLFQFRFAAGRGLKGHNFGNLFLAVLSQITGDFAHAVRLSSEVLAIAGRIFPSTSDNVSLRAVLEDGEVVEGETRISRSASPIRAVQLIPPRCNPLPETLEAIRRADLITLGPGSLYTSLVPNLLVSGIASAIETSPAMKACVLNLMGQPGETIGLSAAAHLRAIHRHARRPLIEFAIVNDQPFDDGVLRRYAPFHAGPVTVDLPALRELGVRVIARPLLGEGEKVRHDPGRLAAVVVGLARKARRRILARARASVHERG
jgi:uncharacterized cofD-like protein